MATPSTPPLRARVRVAGGGFTLFTFNGQPIAFCEQVAHTSPRPVAQFSEIHPMDEPYPVEILVPPAATAGTLTLNLFELFGTNGNASKVWDRLGANIGGINGQGLAFGSSDPAQNTSPAFQQLINSQGTPQTPFAGAVDIVDVFIRQAMIDPDSMQIVKWIRPLSAGVLVNGAFSKPYVEQYVGCQITDVVDGETVAIGTVEVIKQITVAYRYLMRGTNGGAVTSAAFQLRHGGLGNPTWLP